jgi:hypothetical protein
MKQMSIQTCTNFKIQVFWDVIPCYKTLFGWVEPEEEGTTVLKNVGNSLAVNMAEDLNLQQHHCERSWKGTLL